VGINTEEIKKIAKLARIDLDEAKVPEYEQNLSEILNLAKAMEKIDTKKIQPMAHPLSINQPLRKDKVTELDQREELLAIAPSTEAGLFLVPKVIEDKITTE